MNKNVLIGLGVAGVLVVGVLGFILLKPKAPVSEPASKAMPVPESTGPVMEKEVTVEVSYTSSGFSPTTVTIKKGATVKFINKSGNKMDVASNPHPTHTDYSGFDQWKSASKGKDEYSFTFEKVGTWGYHNHAKASDGGTVVVTE